jgi:hypothetical protein
MDKIKKKVKRILKESDTQEKLDDFEYEKISTIVSILARSDADIRAIFYRKTHELLKAMEIRVNDKYGFLTDVEFGKINGKIIN